MGHTSGIGKVGAEYDRTPEIYEKVIEGEYEKLEPFINIYSSPIAKRETDPLLRDVEHLAQIPSVREVLTEVVADIKTRLEQLARTRKKVKVPDACAIRGSTCTNKCHQIALA